MLLRVIALVCVAALALGCAGSETSGSPTAPTPQPAPTPAPSPAPTPQPPAPPPPAIVQIGGAWSGSHEIQQQGTRFFGRVAVTFEQNDREVRGSWLFTEGAGSALPGFNAWRGEITGTLSLDANGATRFSGTATIVAEIQGRTGACHGRVPIEGTVAANSIRFDGPNVTFSDCLNTIGGLVWILSRTANPGAAWTMDSAAF